MARKAVNTYAKAHSAAVVGVEARIVEVECRQSLHLPGFSVVGIAQRSARDARERVCAALLASGLRLPSRKIVLNLSPALAWRDEGRGFDLPIALTCLVAGGQLPAECLRGKIFLGELSLDGALKESRALSALPNLLRRQSFDAAIVPAAGFIPSDSLPIFGFRNLRELVDFLRGHGNAPVVVAWEAPKVIDAPEHLVRLENIRGHAPAKRMLEISAAGEHHTLLAGPRGAGKSLLAHAMPSILPPLTRECQEEMEAIYAAGGLAWDRVRPFRVPHSSLTAAALLGGGPNCSPGELSFAHHGILFLDELLEFRRDVLEALRVALESGEVRLARGDRHITLPAAAQLVAATNLCPCGILGDPRHECRCSEHAVNVYRRRLSYALRDRIDLSLSLVPTSENETEVEAPSEQTARSLSAVGAARARMLARQGKLNGRLQGTEIFSVGNWSGPSRRRIELEAERRKYSYRGLVALARVARTIADLEGEEDLKRDHIFEALSFREENLAPTFERDRSLFSWPGRSSPSVA